MNSAHRPNAQRRQNRMRGHTKGGKTEMEREGGGRREITRLRCDKRAC